jgi:transcriptional regulator with XRE-family HTH domain
MPAPSRPKTGDKDVGDRIRMARKRMKLSQEQLALALEVTQGAVSAWENGANAVAPQLLSKLAAELGILPADLVQEESDLSQVRIDQDRLVLVLRRIEDAARTRFLTLAPEKKAKLIAHVYASGRDLTAQDISSLLPLLE